jgi:glycerol-3-phosphate dehydrogenase (NAD(P)+)
VGYTVKKRHDGNEHGFEGYYATKSAFKLNQGYGAKTPIDAVYEILYEGKMLELFSRN